MLGKLERAKLWCDYTERNPVLAFLECLRTGVEIRVNKGIHPDRLAAGGVRPSHHGGDLGQPLERR
jgi:hypothetical protein